MKQLTLMISVPQTARADVLLTEDRIYYRFATEDTVEDGDLPGLKDRYLLTENRIKEALTLRTGEKPLPQDAIKVQLFVDNAKVNLGQVSGEGIERVASELQNIDDVFCFLGAFSTKN